MRIHSGPPATDELKVASRQASESAISGGRALRGVRGGQRQPRAPRTELGAVRRPGRDYLNKTERANQGRGARGIEGQCIRRRLRRAVGRWPCARAPKRCAPSQYDAEGSENF